MTKLNLDFYSGIDHYSDGKVEDELLEIVKTQQDFTQLLQQTNNWAILYHLSPLRRNLLEWFDFAADKTLLEIGGGCGAFSGMFAEKLSTVKVVELSRKRAEIIYHRHPNYANLEIIAGNLNAINFTQQFDYVTLIGVLEYAGKFTPGPEPFKDFLCTVKQFLKPGGSLIIAIENKFGLKYWAGAREDHTGRNFESIEGYPEDKAIQTFGKAELSELIKSAGFTTMDYYYPMPDYKLPTVIYSDAYLPTERDFFAALTPNYDQPRYKLFNESLAYQNIIRNKMFDFFANSFLLFAS